MALTGKKRLFAEALLAGKSNKEAALAAGYSAASASAAGSRLAKDKDVLAHQQRKAVAAEKPKEVAPAEAAPLGSFDLSQALAHRDPRAFLLAAMNDVLLEPKLRIDAAKALMPFEFAKKGEGGKKEQQADAAKKVASRFTPAAPPKLATANGKKV
ncbi:terminase small subunit [Comamonas testosteroni]|uniref:terminase small subunit n=1 Tax=Comamonas testosteroni TaxID=285 RepID=UPI0023AAC862|nr:terminase small subunit [Comamonas testosteroni]WEE79750.1 terminase small subunit [Comamonas testosteroni]